MSSEQETEKKDICGNPGCSNEKTTECPVCLTSYCSYKCRANDWNVHKKEKCQVYWRKPHSPSLAYFVKS